MILLIRHAPAGDRIRWAIQGRPDDLRPLTPKGTKKFTRAARRLSKTVKPKLIVSSELVRSMQTAELLARHNLKAQVQSTMLLGNQFEVKKLARLVRHLERLHGTVALIGHEPTLSILLTYLVTGTQRPIGKLKKGAVACLEMQGKRHGVSWLMDMDQLCGDSV